MVSVSVVLAIVLAAQTALKALNKLNLTGFMYPSSASVSDGDAFDYIIVGGGTSGSVVASRLVASGSSVLLIEAGGNPPLESHIGLTVPLQITSDVDYKYNAAPNSEKDITKYRRNDAFNYISGKMLGGSSNMFTNYHIRADPQFYDQWAETLQDSSYNYQSLLTYFKKSEKVEDEEIFQQSGSEHGTEGPIGLQRRPYGILNKYLDAFAELGNKILIDKNGENNVGYFHPLYEMGDGLTQGAARKYLGLVKENEKLHVLKDTQVTKILFDSDNKATGVEVQGEEGVISKIISKVKSLISKKNNTPTFKANKEVILAAGVLNTPKVLMLSGIGPKEHLESFKIDVKADLPVGQNLQDLYGAVLGYKLKKESLLVPFETPLFPYPYFAGYSALNKSQNIPEYLTENYHVAHDLPLASIYCATVLGFKNEACEAYQDTESAGQDFYLTIVVEMDPKSRGSVQLKSANPSDYPKITAPYLNNLEDLDRIVDYVRDHHRILNTTYFQSKEAQFVKPISDCDDFEVGSKDYWYCYVPKMLTSIFKYTSSCAMGSVVDTAFKVKGFNNLRVVDASTFPSIPRAHVISTVLAMAEKAADLIIADSSKYTEVENKQ